MRRRTRHLTKIVPAGLALAAIACVQSPQSARADDGVPLLHVARTLGFSYRYLQFENAVELIRPGAVIVVRPGDTFFTANGRIEPVDGMAPEYHDNDVYVSASFANEIRGLGSPYRSAPVPVQSYARAPRPTGTVTKLELAHVPATSRITITGKATPGAPVRIVLKSKLSSSLPLETIDSVEAVADANGDFSTVMSTEPVHFALAHFIVEASSPNNTAPLVRELIPLEEDPSNRTEADTPP